jgi:hypothetical protein
MHHAGRCSKILQWWHLHSHWVQSHQSTGRSSNILQWWHLHSHWVQSHQSTGRSSKILQWWHLHSHWVQSHQSTGRSTEILQWWHLHSHWVQSHQHCFCIHSLWGKVSSHRCWCIHSFLSPHWFTHFNARHKSGRVLGRYNLPLSLNVWNDKRCYALDQEMRTECMAMFMLELS